MSGLCRALASKKAPLVRPLSPRSTMEGTEGRGRFCKKKDTTSCTQKTVGLACADAWIVDRNVHAPLLTHSVLKYNTHSVCHRQTNTCATGEHVM